MLLRVERRFDQRPGGALMAAHDLDDHVDVAALDHCHRIRFEADAAEIHAPVALAFARRYRRDRDVAAGPPGQSLGIAAQHFRHAGSDIAKSREADAKRAAHFAASRTLELRPISPRKRRTLRAAWRIRCPFSTSAIRTWPS